MAMSCSTLLFAAEVGESALDLSLPLIVNQAQNAETVSLSDHQGKIIYLDFWASWCTPCRRSFPWMNDMQKKYGNKNFKVISINVDSERDLAEEFLANTPAKFSVLYDPDGALASEMKLKGMPSSFIINADGVVVSAHVGFTDKKKSLYEQEIKQLIQGN